MRKSGAVDPSRLRAGAAASLTEDAAPVDTKSHAVLGFCLWAAAILVFAAAILIGVIVDAGTTSIYKLAAFFLPIYSCLLCLPLLIASAIVSGRAARVQRRRLLAQISQMLAIFCSLFAGLILFMSTMAGLFGRW